MLILMMVGLFNKRVVDITMYIMGNWGFWNVLLRWVPRNVRDRRKRALHVFDCEFGDTTTMTTTCCPSWLHGVVQFFSSGD
eukprot:689361-Amphidinium_carterae.1